MKTKNKTLRDVADELAAEVMKTLSQYLLTNSKNVTIYLHNKTSDRCYDFLFKTIQEHSKVSNVSSSSRVQGAKK